MEQLHVRAWPARETTPIDGWLWRYSGGGSQRANAVSTVDFTGRSATGALDAAEALYRARGAATRVHTFPAGSPPELAAILAARGYRRGETTLTMLKAIEAGAGRGIEVEATSSATADWLEIYLGAISEDRRAANRAILARIPPPRVFLLCRRDGRAVSTALCVAEDGLAVIECVATRRDARRRGGAETVLAAVEAWAARAGARLLGLQVGAANVPALALYGRLGFVEACENAFWVGGVEQPVC